MFNRLARSCFYEAQKNFEGMMPLCSISEEVVVRAQKALHTYDGLMRKVELHTVMSLMDEFIRYSNKYWTDGIREAELSGDADARRQVLADSFYLLRICTLLMHPIVPFGCEKICMQMNFDADEFFSWNYDFEGMASCAALPSSTRGRIASASFRRVLISSRSTKARSRRSSGSLRDCGHAF